MNFEVCLVLGGVLACIWTIMSIVMFRNTNNANAIPSAFGFMLMAALVTVIGTSATFIQLMHDGATFWPTLLTCFLANVYGFAVFLILGLTIERTHKS